MTNANSTVRKSERAVASRCTVQGHFGKFTMFPNSPPQIRPLGEQPLLKNDSYVSLSSLVSVFILSIPPNATIELFLSLSSLQPKPFSPSRRRSLSLLCNQNTQHTLSNQIHPKPTTLSNQWLTKKSKQQQVRKPNPLTHFTKSQKAQRISSS